MSATTPSPSTKQIVIHVYMGDDSALEEFNDLQNALLECVGADTYVINKLDRRMLMEKSWNNTCSLLLVSGENIADDLWSVVLDIFNSGGRILTCGTQSERLDMVEQTVASADGQPSVSNQKESGKDSPDNEKLNQLRSSGYRGLQNTKGGKLMYIPSPIVQLSKEKTAADSSTLSAITQLRNCLDILRVTPCLVACPQNSDLRKEVIETLMAYEQDSNYGEAPTFLKIGELLISVPEEEHGKLLEQGFDINMYAETLKSTSIGQTVIFQAMSKTTQDVINTFSTLGPKNFGLVSIAADQTNGRGRGGTIWQSAKGSMHMTMYVKVEYKSTLEKSKLLLNTVPAVAVARIVEDLLSKKEKQKHDRKVQVKWPNDIYYGSEKIGGVLVEFTPGDDCYHAAVGVGVNVANKYRTATNIDGIIDAYNASEKEHIDHISVTWMVARVCSETELLIEMIKNDVDRYLDEYHKYWMHTGVKVDVPSKGITQGSIIGLNKVGNLVLQVTEIVEIESGAYSFDIENNVLHVK